MAKRGQPVKFRLAKVCAVLDKSECELAHALGLSRAALRAIDRPGAPLYLKLALTAMMDGLEPAPLFQRHNDSALESSGSEQMKMVG